MVAQLYQLTSFGLSLGLMQRARLALQLVYTPPTEMRQRQGTLRSCHDSHCQNVSDQHLEQQ